MFPPDFLSMPHGSVDLEGCVMLSSRPMIHCGGLCPLLSGTCSVSAAELCSLTKRSLFPQLCYAPAASAIPHPVTVKPWLRQPRGTSGTQAHEKPHFQPQITAHLWSLCKQQEMRGVSLPKAAVVLWEEHCLCLWFLKQSCDLHPTGGHGGSSKSPL